MSSSERVPLGYFLETEPVAMAAYTIHIDHLTADRDHLDFGAMAAVNAVKAVSLLVEKVDWSFWCDIPPLTERHALANCRHFLVPDHLHTGRLYWSRLAWEASKPSDLGMAASWIRGWESWIRRTAAFHEVLESAGPTPAQSQSILE